MKIGCFGKSVFIVHSVPISYHRIEINQKSNSMSAPLKFMSSRMSPRASHRRYQYAILVCFPAVLTAGFFRIYVPNVSLRNRKMSLKGQKCRENSPGWRQYGVKIAYWWRIFGHAHRKKRGTSFHESWTSGWSLFYAIMLPFCFLTRRATWWFFTNAWLIWTINTIPESIAGGTHQDTFTARTIELVLLTQISSNEKKGKK